MINQSSQEDIQNTSDLTSHQELPNGNNKHNFLLEIADPEINQEDLNNEVCLKK